MYFSCASDLNCNTAPEHIQNVYEKYDGQAQKFVLEKAEHTVFERRIEMETKALHRIVYVKSVSEFELLSCELVLKKKEAGKRLANRIIKDFEIMVKSCRVKKK